MNKEIHKLLLLIDNEAIETHEYFQWKEEERAALDDFIFQCIIIATSGKLDRKLGVMHSLWQVIKECEAVDEFEQAAILNRTLRRLEKDIRGE